MLKHVQEIHKFIVNLLFHFFFYDIRPNHPTLASQIVYACDYQDLNSL